MLQLIYTLTGDPTYPPILDEQLDGYVRKLRHMLENAIWVGRLRDRGQAEALFSAYTSLTPASQSAVFLSPDGYNALHMLSLSTSEENLVAMADLCRRFAAEEQQPTASSPDILNEPVEVCGLLAVDFGSEFCRREDPTSPVFFGEFEPHTLEEAHFVADKLTAAISEIQVTSSTFARLIQLYGRRVYVRKHGNLSPASEQVDTELGGIRLRNVHLPEYSHDQLMDDLLHESVHNFLATFELLNYPFLVHGGRNDGNIRPVSPWSLRPIRVLPFVHAAFVYFSLLHYAELRLASPDLSETQRSESMKRRDRYVSGYLMPGTLSGKVRSDVDVDVRALQMLDWMQALVIDKYTEADSADPLQADGDPVPSETLAYA